MHEERKRRRRQLVAIDGEGIGSGRAHRYALMCSSEGEEIENLDGLSPKEIAGFLLDLKEAHGNAIFVGFGTGYEAAMLARGLDQTQLGRLWAESQVDVLDPEPYGFPARIIFAERIFYGISELEYDKEYEDWYAIEGRSIRVNDLVKFTQESFLESMERFKIRDKNGTIERGKNSRHKFRTKNMESIRKYCRQETLAIQDLAQRFDDKLWKLDISDTQVRMNGSGSVASAILSRSGAKEHRGETREWSKMHNRRGAVSEALLCAYFGGRTEAFRQGSFPRTTRYDMRSAYAWSVADLPSAVGTWKRLREYDPSVLGVWRVKWQIPRETLYAPLPYRRDRLIYYPLEGEGWYHSDELATALARWPNEIAVTSGYRFMPDNPDARPFALLADVYEKRQTLDESDPAAAHLLKLGLAAVWGKLAQRDFRSGGRVRPATYRDMLWAGLATARVRASMARLAEYVGDHRLIAQSTDALVIEGGPSPMADLLVGDGLGQLSVSRLDKVTLAAANIYAGVDPETGDEITVTSGFLSRTIDAQALREAWRKGKQDGWIDVGGRRFVGIGSAIMLGGDLGTWADWPQVLNLGSDKFYDAEEVASRGQRRTLYPPAKIGDGRGSEAYRFEPVLREGEPDEDEHEKAANSGNPPPEGS